MYSLTGLAYFGAIETFGVEKLLSRKIESFDKLKFLQTHLIGCVKEKNNQFFGEIQQILSSKQDSQTGFVITADDLNTIIHFKTDEDRDIIFSKTALTWAMDNSDQYMAIELLKLEHNFHKTEKEGLECLRDNLSSHDLLPWIFETYSKFYNKTQYWQSLRTVIVDLVLLSYIPYFMDIYFDIALAKSYRAYSSENFSVTELWSCGDIELNSSCYEGIGSDHAPINHIDSSSLTFAVIEATEDIKKSFDVAFWITIFLILITVVFYIVSITFDSPTSWLTSLQRTGREYSGKDYCCRQSTIMAWFFQKFLICVSKLLWPIVHCGWQLLYLAAPKRSHYKQNLDNSTAIWNSIKMVEYGLESSLQLLLQLWLLRPFLPTIMTWDTSELISKCASGLANFLLFGIIPACYIEKALAKIVLTIFFLSLGISQMKKKAGQSFAKTLPMFVSIFAQTVGRIGALISLVLMTTSLGYFKYALFFTLHILLVFMIKTLVEVTALRDNLQYPCSLQHKQKKQVWRIIKFIASGLSSTIVMIHLRRDNEEQHKRHPSLLSHSCFHILILFENLLLACFPYIANGRYYPSDDCFPPSSQYNVICIVILAWFIGVVAQSIHYKYCSPLSELNGPRASSWCPPAQISCLATLCWKREIHKIELNELDWHNLKGNR
jgi:hypothetical protein